MFLSSVSIRRPILASIMNLFIVVLGLLAYRGIGVSNYPNIDAPVVQVVVSMDGASPGYITQNILNPVESSLRSVEGVVKIESTVTTGKSTTVVTFDLSRSADAALNDVRNQMYNVTGASTWPSDADTPVVRQMDPNAAPTVYFAISSAKLSDIELAKYVNDIAEPEIQQVQGVGDVFIGGLRLPEYDIFFDNEKLKSLNLSPNNLVTQIQKAINALPSGNIENDTRYYSVDSSTTPHSIEDLQNVSVQLNNGGQALLKDVARVVRTLQKVTSASEFNLQPALLIVVTKKSTANTVMVSQSVIEKVNELNHDAEGKSFIKLAFDTSLFISDSINAVKKDFLIGGALTVLIVFLFLHDFRATMISAIAIPTSVLGALVAMRLLGFTLNSMTTLALSLCIGIIIDDAIVVVENIHKHMEMGKSPLKAAKDAMNEIGEPAIAITLAIFAVFMPVAFMSGTIGRFFYEFSITVSVAVFISLFVAFTLTPALSSRLLKTHEKRDEASKPSLKERYYAWFNKHFTTLEKKYERLLALSLQYKNSTILFGVLTFVGSVLLLKFVPMTYLPATDQGVFAVTMTVDANSSIAETTRRGEEMTRYIQTFPGIKDVLFYLPDHSTVKLIATLVDPKERQYTQMEIQGLVREKIDQLKKTPDEVFTVGEAGGKKEAIQVVFTGDAQVVASYAKKVETFLASLNEPITDLHTDAPLNGEQIKVSTNYFTANPLNIASSDIAQTLQSYLYGQTIGTFSEGDGNSYSIVTRVEPQQSQAPEDVTNYVVQGSSNVTASLGSVAHVSLSPQDSTILHYNGLSEVSVLGNYSESNLGGISEKLVSFIHETLPAGVHYYLEGDIKNLEESGKAFAAVLVLSFLFAYMVLCGQFESFLTPFVILLSVPLAFSGAFIALLLTQQPLSLYALIGLILLTGIVKKNAILLLDFAERHIAEGMPVETALIKAGGERIRPILMTSFAMIFGMVPLAYSTDLGHELRAPMGVAVIGGLVSSTVLTLLVIPSVYLEFLRLKEKLFKKSVAIHRFEKH